MDDLKFGTRNKRGDWRPDSALALPGWIQGGSAGWAWLRSYLFGWNAVLMSISLVYWFFLIPDLSEMATLEWGWALKLLAINMTGIFLFFGGFEFWLYQKRKQDNRFKYNGQFPADAPSSVFWLSSQNLDNLFRSVFITVPLGSLIEILALWSMASGIVPIGTNPLWFVILIVMTPLIHESYFFFIHWLIHQGWLYKYVHSVHHNSINPSPWSSLSMHPIEGLLYFGTLGLHLLIFSNPFTLIWAWVVPAYGAVIGHVGFDKIEIGEDKSVDSHAYAHYLHHKYFEVNYCDDGVLPWDKWFGTWHDGTPEGDRLMKERFQRKKLKANKGK